MSIEKMFTMQRTPGYEFPVSYYYTQLYNIKNIKDIPVNTATYENIDHIKFINKLDEFKIEYDKITLSREHSKKNGFYDESFILSLTKEKIFIYFADIGEISDFGVFAERPLSNYMTSCIHLVYPIMRNANTQKLVNTLEEILLSSIIPDNKQGNINIITQGHGGFSLQPIAVNIPVLDVKLNYGVAFEKVDKFIKESLIDNKKTGLYLFRGSPGSGKTSYIKHLIGTLEKDFIFLPPNLVSSISDPSFTTFLIQQKNKVLVIEDAERVLLDRDIDGGSTGGVSNILNLSDGLLGDGLNIKIIATENKDKARNDTALFRKGRMLVDYEFGPLSVVDANALAKKLEIKATFTEPTVLTDIYNYETEQVLKEANDKKIGFNVK
jgi:hypothetical protein